MIGFQRFSPTSINANAKESVCFGLPLFVILIDLLCATEKSLLCIA